MRSLPILLGGLFVSLFVELTGKEIDVVKLTSGAVAAYISWFILGLRQNKCLGCGSADTLTKRVGNLLALGDKEIMFVKVSCTDCNQTRTVQRVSKKR